MIEPSERPGGEGGCQSPPFPLDTRGRAGLPVFRHFPERIADGDRGEPSETCSRPLNKSKKLDDYFVLRMVRWLAFTPNSPNAIPSQWATVEPIHAFWKGGGGYPFENRNPSRIDKHMRGI